MKSLVIVESPSKAKTISKFLGKDFIVKSSYGHVRDLPKKELAIDIENNYKPKYVITDQAKKRVKALKDELKKVDAVYLATDEDREGEAISWHLTKVLNLKDKKVYRIVFHEITKKAILKAIENPRDLDLNLVNAQQARRVVDRLVGYKLSPFLWKKIAYGLSAGRVQSVAVRLIVEREREIADFIPKKYWEIKAFFDNENYLADLVEYKNKKIKKESLDDLDFVKEILKDLKERNYIVKSIEKKESRRKTLAPFTTSTLQQAANNKLNFSAKQTMMIAQKLYEGIKLGKEGAVGLITYMRTDSVNLSDEFIESSRKYILDNFGKEYLPTKKKIYKSKSKNAQEAHEAIRPTSVLRDPESVKEYLDPKEYKLYKLIWERALASQMEDVKINNTIIHITDDDEIALFKVKGSVVAFDGFSKVYSVQVSENELKKIPEENNKINLDKIFEEEHETKAPAHYTEASLVKVLEEYGIGRPSTYAPTLDTIQKRGYVVKEDKKLLATDIAFIVNDLLVGHFPRIVDYNFTADLEEDFDEIALGKKDWVKVVDDFYKPFIKNLEEKEKTITKETIQDLSNEYCPKCGAKLIIKKSRFGAFWACSNYPECDYTRDAKGRAGQNKEEEIANEVLNEKCPECGADLVIKNGKFGRFIACSNYPECKYTRTLTMGIKCPRCGEGELVERKTKRGKLYYTCSRYPECDFSSWYKPYEKQPCPECKKGYLYWKNKNIVKCDTCDYEKKIEKKED